MAKLKVGESFILTEEMIEALASSGSIYDQRQAREHGDERGKYTVMQALSGYYHIRKQDFMPNFECIDPYIDESEIIVYAETQEDYYKLMAEYDRVGWRWRSGDSASSHPEYWRDYREHTYVGYENSFAWGSINKAGGAIIITVDEAIKRLREQSVTLGDGETTNPMSMIEHQFESPIQVQVFESNIKSLSYPLTKKHMENDSLSAKVSRLFKGEPAKSAEKLGFENENGRLTSEGANVFVQWLYDSQKKEFAEAVIYPLRDEEKKDKKK